MPATTPRTDPALVRSLIAGDEGALEKIFRLQYPALVGEAATMLDGDGAAAARGIEAVFVQLWKSRAELTAPQMIDAAIQESVRSAVARIKSRHAVAHQLGEFEGAHATEHKTKPAPSVDDAWVSVHRGLHPDEAHAAAVAQEMASHTRHGAATDIIEMAKPRRQTPMLIGGALFLVVIAGIAWWATRASEAAALTAGLAARDARASATQNAEYNNVTLSDKSTVKLGPDSKLVIPRAYGGAIRGVKLDGSATFTVSPGQAHQFVVRAGNATITARGTVFSVRAYPDERAVYVRVHEGSVSVTVGDSLRQLAQNAVLVVGSDSGLREPAGKESEEAFGWTDGMVVAADRPLRDVMVLARRWFNLNFNVADPALLERRVTLSAPVGNAVDAVKSIETSGSLRRVWKGEAMVLEDHTAPAKKR